MNSIIEISFFTLCVIDLSQILHFVIKLIKRVLR